MKEKLYNNNINTKKRLNLNVGGCVYYNILIYRNLN